MSAERGKGSDASQKEQILRAAYLAFNARHLETALGLMHPAVDWPNAWEGGRAQGRAAVSDYWNRQFESVASEVEPEMFEHQPDGTVIVTVHQVVHDARTGDALSDARVRHRFSIREGLIARMDVIGPGA